MKGGRGAAEVEEAGEVELGAEVEEAGSEVVTSRIFSKYYKVENMDFKIFCVGAVNNSFK